MLTVGELQKRLFVINKNMNISLEIIREYFEKNRIQHSIIHWYDFRENACMCEINIMPGKDTPEARRIVERQMTEKSGFEKISNNKYQIKVWEKK